MCHANIPPQPSAYNFHPEEGVRVHGTCKRRKNIYSGLCQRFLEAFLEKLSFYSADPVYEQGSVKVVYLVLESPAKEPVGLDLQRPSLPVETAHNDPFRPYNACDVSGKTEASLLAFDFALGRFNFGIYHHYERSILIFPDAHIDDYDPFRKTNLGGRQSDAGRSVHGLNHVVDEALYLSIYFAYRESFLFKDFFRVFFDFEYRHEVLYHTTVAKEEAMASEAVLLRTEMPDIGVPKRGKVRDIYDLGDLLLLIATDRLSAFDVVLPNGIPGKGKVLTRISVYWFRKMQDIIRNHIVAIDVDDFPPELKKYRDILDGRSMLVRKAETIPVECIVRGYLSGSGWSEYKEKGSVCGISLPGGLPESSRLDEPIFTPSTKAEEGHDINISFEQAGKIVGRETAARLKETSIRIYMKARDIAEKKGIIIADTKFEFGLYDEELMLIDEILTPDSSRFWSVRDYRPGSGQDSFDKQIVRDYLLTLDWDKRAPGPVLPDTIVAKTVERYREIMEILTKD